MEPLTLLAYVGCTLVTLVTAGLSIISARIAYEHWKYSIPQTTKVILETLRLYRPSFQITKKAPPEGLTLGGYYIPGGTSLLLPTSLLCRLPEYFDNPDTFNPDRFDPENNQPSSFVYFPFGLGHRSCIGKHFALMETKLILARLVQTFNITLPPDYKLVLAYRFITQPKDSVPCKLALRN